MNDIKPLSHGERKTTSLHYHVVDLPEMPEGFNSVTIFWSVPMLSRLKLLLTGKLQTSFKTHSVVPLRIDV